MKTNTCANSQPQPTRPLIFLPNTPNLITMTIASLSFLQTTNFMMGHWDWHIKLIHYEVSSFAILHAAKKALSINSAIC